MTESVSFGIKHHSVYHAYSDAVLFAE